MSTRAQALSLYRDILRASRRFHWADELGRPWRDRVLESARLEFEQSRRETDTLIIARLLVVGRDCLNETLFKIDDAERKIHERIARERDRK